MVFAVVAAAGSSLHDWALVTAVAAVVAAAVGICYRSQSACQRHSGAVSRHSTMVGTCRTVKSLNHHAMPCGEAGRLDDDCAYSDITDSVAI